ncbi:carboxypeptidase-like regulatory domain-containing protein [Fibrobacterota bacterium]
MMIKVAFLPVLFLFLKNGTAYEVVKISNGGIITGTVKYSGMRYKDTLVKVGTHAEYCGEWVNPGRLIVSDDSGIKWVAVMIKRIEKGKEFDSTPMFLVHNINCRFEPRVSIIKERLPITIKNSDRIPHRAKFGLRDSTGWISNFMAIAVPWSEKEIPVKRLINHTGLVSIAGIIHPFEQGWVWKLPHPYAAVTDTDGKFRISNIPEGIYEILIWHEFLGEQNKTVMVRRGETSLINISFKN